MFLQTPVSFSSLRRPIFHDPSLAISAILDTSLIPGQEVWLNDQSDTDNEMQEDLSTECYVIISNPVTCVFFILLANPNNGYPRAD